MSRPIEQPSRVENACSDKTRQRGGKTEGCQARRYEVALTGEGKRIFKMSPLHHHFQKCGWSETQVVVRFWLVGAMLAAFAMATIRLR